MKKIVLIFLFGLLFMQVSAAYSNKLNREITLLIHYNYDWAPNYAIIIHADSTGLLQMSTGQINDICCNWNDNIFSDISDSHFEESYKLSKEDIAKLNKLLRNEKSLHFIGKGRVISGLQYVIYLDGKLFFNLSHFYFEHSTEMSEIECIPYDKIIENPKKIIDILTKRIENKFNFF